MALYTREQADKIKAEASEETRAYIEELEGRLLRMYGIAHQFSLMTTGQGLAQPEEISDVLYSDMLYKEEASV